MTVMPPALMSIEMPDTRVLPNSLYAHIATLPRSTLIPQGSVLEYFLKQSMGIRRVERSFYLEDAGASAATRIIAFKADIVKVEGITPVIFEQFAPVVKGYSFQVNCHMRTGGVVVRYPGSVRYMDGC